MRPQPPGSVICSVFPMFEPSPDLERWARETLINADSEFSNPDHEHLQDAVIGFLWTNTENASKGRRVIGQAEQPIFRCGKWQKARQEMQIRDWFGDPTPDFIITLDAIYCMDCTDMEFMALVDHELMHCGQSMDEHGSPRFNRDTGLPIYAIRDHDVQEFVSIVRRYGAITDDVKAIVEAANSKPLICGADISKMCGSCIKG